MSNQTVHTLFEKIERANLIKRRQISLGTLDKMSFSSLLDLVDEISTSTVVIDKETHASAYAHSASLSLGGGRYGCTSLRCRTRKLDEIARFAALYSDEVYIHNFASTYSPTFGHPPDHDSPKFRQWVQNDLTLLLHIQPLIKSGSIRLFTPPTKYCPVCLAERVFGSETGKRIKAARNMVTRRILDELSVEVTYHEEYDHPSYELRNVGLDDIFGHPIITEYFEIPDVVGDNKALIKRLHDGKKVTLSKEQLAHSDYARQIASKLLRNCTFHLSVASVLDAAVVTDSNADIDVLSYITKNEPIEKRNRISADHLQAMVPFAGDVPIARLLELRQRENDSFIQFRAALDKSIDAASKQKGEFTVRDAKMLYADVIAPETSRLKRKVSEAKRDLVVKPLASAVGTIALIGFGIYTGMLPTELTQIAGFLGLAKTIYDTATKVTELADIEKSIRPEAYYYLWKVKHSAQS